MSGNTSSNNESQMHRKLNSLQRTLKMSPYKLANKKVHMTDTCTNKMTKDIMDDTKENHNKNIYELLSYENVRKR